MRVICLMSACLTAASLTGCGGRLPTERWPELKTTTDMPLMKRMGAGDDAGGWAEPEAPEGALGRLGAFTFRHAGGAAPALSPDGRTLAVVALNPTDIALLSAETGRIKQTLTGHTERITALAFSPSGALASGDISGTLTLWSAQAEPLRTESGAHKKAITALAWSPDGEILASAGLDGAIKRWSPSGELRQTSYAGAAQRQGLGRIRGRVRPGITTLVWSPDGSQLAATGRRHEIWIEGPLDARSEVTAPCRTPRVAFVPDKALPGLPQADAVLAVGCPTPRVWTVPGPYEQAHIVPDKESQAVAIGFDDAGHMVTVIEPPDAALAADPELPVAEVQWYSGRGQPMQEAAESPMGQVRHLVGPPGGAPRFLANEHLLVPLPAPGAERGDLPGHAGALTGASYSPDGTVIATASRDRTARLWDARSGAALGALPIVITPVLSAAFSPDGSALFLGGAGGELVRWSLTDGAGTLFEGALSGAIHGMAFSGDGQRVALAGGFDHGTGERPRRGETPAPIVLWDVLEEEATVRLEGHPSPPWAVAQTAGSERVAAVGDHYLCLWQLEWPETPEGASPPTEPLSVTATGCQDISAAHDVVFSPDGAQVAVARGGGVALHDATTGEPIKRLKLPTEGRTRSVGWSLDGALVVAGDEAGEVHIWKVEGSDQPLASHFAHGGAVTTIAFSPDGRTVVSGGADQLGVVWPVPEGAKPHTKETE